MRSTRRMRKEAIEALLAGSIDLAIGRLWDLPRSVTARRLFDESYSVVASPTAGDVCDLDFYLSARHIVVSLDGDLTGVVDEALRAMGRSRNVVAATPYFLSALAAAAESAVIVTLPSRLATTYAPLFGLNVFSPPLALAPFTVSEVVSASRAKGDIVRWLFETVLPTAIGDAFAKTSLQA
jgi:DNA-binding transcriptional LysR family regulator